MDWPARIESYARVTGFPASLFVAGDGRVVGTWIMGNDYRVKSGYYGGYPAGYLRRVAALFPDRKRVLHVFSGKVDLTAMPGDTVDCNPAVRQPGWPTRTTCLASHSANTTWCWPTRHTAWKTPSATKPPWCSATWSSARSPGA